MFIGTYTLLYRDDVMTPSSSVINNRLQREVEF